MRVIARYSKTHWQADAAEDHNIKMTQELEIIINVRSWLHMTLNR